MRKWLSRYKGIIFTSLLEIIIIVIIIFLRTYLYEHRATIVPLSFAVVVPTLSIFGAIYSNLIHNAEMAEGNMYSYTLQADIASDRKIINLHRRIAKEWLTISESFRRLVKLRAYSFIWCSLSLILLLITTIVFLCTGEHWCWLIPFSISAVLLILALLTYIRSLEFTFFDRLYPKIPLIATVLKRSPEIEDCIRQHPWLRAHLRKIRAETLKHNKV